MREALGAIFDPLSAALGAVPLGAGRFITVGFLLLATVATLFLPANYVYLGSPDRRRWRDLRLWAVSIMLPYLLIYSCL